MFVFLFLCEEDAERYRTIIMPGTTTTGMAGGANDAWIRKVAELREMFGKPMDGSVSLEVSLRIKCSARHSSFVKIGKVWKEGKKKGRKEGKLSTILTIEKAIKYCTCYVL